MHILFFPSWYPSQISPQRGVFFREQAEALISKQIKVGVVYPELCSVRNLSLNNLKYQRFNFTFQKENNVNVLRWNAWSFPKLTRWNAWLYKTMIKNLLKKYIIEFGTPDIIHAQGLLWGGIAAADMHKEFSIPFVITEHSSVFPRKLIHYWQHNQIINAANEAAKVMSVSKFLANSINEIGYRGPIEIMPNLVDVDFFTLPVDGKKREDQIFRFIVIAFLSKNKGIDNLIRAFSNAFSNDERVILEIGGDGQECDYLKNLVNQLGISHKVFFLGALDKVEVRNAIWRANSLVLSSYVETFGVVLIEAMATGLPVIATKCGGPEDFVPLHLQCKLVEPENIVDLAEAMSSHFHARDELIQLQLKLRDYVCSNFSCELVGSRLVDLYSKLTKNV